MRWEHLNRLLDHGGGLPLTVQIRQQADAIRDHRSLINDPDPVRPLVDDLSSKLRERLLSLHDALEVERRARVAELVDMPEWHEISNEAKDSVLLNVELLPLGQPDVGDDAKLLDALRATPISTLEASLDAIPKRMERARAEILALRPRTRWSRSSYRADRSRRLRTWMRTLRVRQTLLKQLGNDGKVTLLV